MNDAFEAAIKQGREARESGDLRGALGHYQRAEDICDSKPDYFRRAFAARHISDLQLSLGRFDNALDAALSAEAIYRGGIGEPLDLANVLRLVALGYGGLGHENEALHYWRQAMMIYDKLGVVEGVAECQAHMA